MCRSVSYGTGLSQKVLLLKACQVELNNARIQGLKRLQLHCDNCLHKVD